MIHELTVTCDDCGCDITHIVCGPYPTRNEDPDWYLCESCIPAPEPDYDEPDHNDAVLCCPDCERPNQFGERCLDCERDVQIGIAENRL